jgi:hypothetical protein
MVLRNEGDPAQGLHRLELTPRLTRSIVLVTWRRLEISPAVIAFVEELRTAAFNDPTNGLHNGTRPAS